MNNIIYILNKPKAKQRIEISVDSSMDKDGWFLKINFIEKSSSAIASTHCVIEKDIHNWIRGFVTEGWIVESEQINKII